jgi:DNA integrity scanning protein DisA with diadenylate cyclase activity
MSNEIVGKLSAFHVFEGLQDGLSHFSGPSRVAIIYTLSPDAPMRIYDPQKLLRGHEPKLRELYLDSRDWQKNTSRTRGMSRFNQPISEANLQLAGLISTGGKSRSIFYQMWFTEHHPDICNIGPTERWLEHAVWMLSQEVGSQHTEYTGASSYVVREYAPHAVRDFLVDELNRRIGMDVQIRIYPILDAILGISQTMEEGVLPRGELVFVEPGEVDHLNFVARFPLHECPHLKNVKHVRKLLQAVEHSTRKLISDGRMILGIASGEGIGRIRLVADFRGRHGFIRLADNLVCSFSYGNFHSSTRRAKLVQLEEILLETSLEPSSHRHDLFKIVSYLVHYAEDQKFGCTLVVDTNPEPLIIAGQHLEFPLDLTQSQLLELTRSLARMDGALHIGGDLQLHGFACILDGHAVPGEDRSRGARFNSALRFTAEQPHVVVVVVSADRPVSVIQEGVELSAKCDWEPISSLLPSPPTLADWLRG